MKKLKLLALSLMVIFLSGGVAFAIDAPTVNGEIKGVKGRDQDDECRIFKLVRNSGAGLNGVSIVSGDAVVYDTVSDDGVSVRTTTTSADNAFAGIAVTAIPSSDAVTGVNAGSDVGRRNWGYILVHGYVAVNVTAAGTNGNAVGDALITSADSGKVTTLENIGTSDPAGIRKVARTRIGGFFFDAADATSTSVDAFIMAE